MNKKGFTLVELLAVIVILAIILAIAVPRITGILNSAKRSAFEADVKLIIKGIEYKMLERDAGAEVPTEVIPENASTEEAPFYMTDDGLVIYYQIYVYTPYAYGPLELFFNYSELEHVIIPKP